MAMVLGSQAESCISFDDDGRDQLTSLKRTQTTLQIRGMDALVVPLSSICHERLFVVGRTPWYPRRPNRDGG